MKYGYFNQFITSIGEPVEAEVAEIAKHVDTVFVDTLGNRPMFDEVVNNSKKGDVIYVYSLARSFSGLTDVVETLTGLYNKGVGLVSIKDGYKVDQTETGKVAFDAMVLASTLISADPNHGFYR